MTETVRSSCTVPECEKPVCTRELCKAHYNRLIRHGHPTAGGAPREAQAFLCKNVSHESDECLTWPFAKDRKGYGLAWYRGYQTTANFVMCTMAHGERPSTLHESAHSCGNGHLACVNPRHLRWATKVENHFDKRAHGTYLFGENGSHAKLTEQHAREIKSATGGSVTQRELANIYGTTTSNVSKIQRGKTWQSLGGNAA